MNNPNNILKLIQAVEDADSAPSLLKAVRELAQAQSVPAIPVLIKVLGYNNPGAAVAAVEGLVALGEIAVEPILNQLDSYNYGARAWTIRALAEIGDHRALDLLILAAETDFALSVRRSAAKGIGSIKWEKMGLSDRPVAQKRVFQTLGLNCEDPEWVVRYAAIVGLEKLAIAVSSDPPDWYPQILALWQKLSTIDAELVIKARCQLAIQHWQKEPISII